MRILVPFMTGVLLLTACSESQTEKEINVSDLRKLRYARTLFQSGDSADAVRRVETIIHDRPAYSEAMMLAGAMYERMNNEKAAKRWYNEAVKILRSRVSNPERWKLPQEMNLAFALFMAGDKEEAIRIVEAQERKASDSPTVDAGGRLIRNGDREQALTMLLGTKPHNKSL